MAVIARDRIRQRRFFSRRRLSYDDVAILSAVLVVFIVFIFLSTKDPEHRTLLSDILGPAVDIVAAASLFAAARSALKRSRRRALAWATLGLAMLCYAAGDSIWTVLELVLKESPFPSLADVFYLAYYPAALAGVVLLTNRALSRGEQIRRALDVVTVLAAAILASWNFLLAPLLATNIHEPLWAQIILVAYPCGDLVLVGALLLLIYADSDRGDIRWIHALAFGIVMTIIADYLYSYESLQGIYVSGSLLDLGWIGGNLIIGLSGASQWTPAPPVVRRPRIQQPGGLQFGLKSFRTYLPYLWLLGSFVLLILRGVTTLPMSFFSLALGVGLVMTLVLVRQLITLSENYRLTTQLRTQATRLQTTNVDLSSQIAERQRMEEKLSYDAVHDGMTGLANRILFMDHLDQAMRRSRRHKRQSLAVLFIDVDHFKVVNDSLGHSYGDQLLVLIGRRLQETVRAIDTVARFGGDEFTILLEDLSERNTARVLTGRIQTAMRRPFQLDSHVVHASVSIGIATNLIKYDRAEEMLRDADLALYYAKARGKARSEVFALDMRQQAYSRLEMEEDLRRGLAAREFQMYYQPVRSLQSDRVVGVEALVRWKHPSRGLLLPADFLEVAEESGLMLQLGTWVLQESCRQLSVWQHRYAEFAHLTLSVNLSNREFSEANLAHKVRAALKASGVKGSALRLEITEQVMVGNRPLARRLIAQLDKLGVEIQIDDFGIGYSALAYLQQFPISAIKIDKSFVSQMVRDRRGLGLVRAMVSMARELGIGVIAEGVETRQQLRELKHLECGFGQGYLLAPPMSAAALEKTLARRKPRPKRSAKA